MTSLMHKSPADQSGDHLGESIRIPRVTIGICCETPEMTATMEKVASDRRMSRAHATIHSGGIAAAVEICRKTSSPNVLVIESRAPMAELDGQLDTLADVCHPGTKVILIGYVNDVSIYRELLARGVSEYIVAPADPLTIITALSHLYFDSGASKLGRSFAFVGAKGGVGSSTIAHNVAATIARTHRHDVILTDLNLPFGSAGLALNLDSTKNIAEALDAKSPLDDMALERLLSKYEDHLSVLTAPANLVQCYDVQEGSFAPVIELAQANVPFVVLDVPHMWTAAVKKTLLTADEVVITAVPDLVCLRNTKNLVDLLKRERPNDAPPKIVLNQVGVPKRAEIKPEQFTAAIRLEPVACIPFEPSVVSAAINNGQVIADLSAKSPLAASFPKIAEAVTGLSAATKNRKRFAFGSLWRGLGRKEASSSGRLNAAVSASSA
jgi:pilus assembly protein CpaE